MIKQNSILLFCFEFIIVLLLTLAIIFGMASYFSPDHNWKSLFFTTSKQSSSSADKTVIQPKVKYWQYYAPVTSFISFKEGLTFAELQQKTLLVLTENQQELKSLFPQTQIIGLSKEELVSRLKSGSEEIAILPITEIDFQWKTLAIDAQNIWDQDVDLVKYPLKIEKKIAAENYSPELTFKPQKLIHVTATGEIILARGVAERIEKYDDVLYPFVKIKEELKKADLTISTLEAPMSSDCHYCDSCMVFCGKPEYLLGLSDSGIDLVSMAANHIKDYGIAGITETINLLEQRQIGHVGAGENLGTARKPWIVEIKGQKFGFLGYNEVVPTTYAATEDSSGSNWAEVDQMKEDIQALKKEVDIVVLMMHWGIEYTNEPSDRQKELAYAGIDAGADLIIGDHPHWVQGVEFYQSKFIIYGIGNFVFDQMWSEETRQGTILDLIYEGTKLVSIKFQPTIIEDYAQPRLATEEEKKVILERIWEGSVF